MQEYDSSEEYLNQAAAVDLAKRFINPALKAVDIDSNWDIESLTWNR